MFIRRTVIAAALVAVPLAFAASAQATPCSYFGDDPNGPDNSICGMPNLPGTFENVQTNLRKNFNPEVAAGNLQDNFNPGTADLEHDITHGVGSDKNSP